MRVETIEQGNYDGYYWLSDATSPRIVSGELNSDFLQIKSNFVIEAQLYDKEKKISYSVKYVDGRYLIMKYLLEEESESCCITELSFISNNMETRKLKFKQYWRPEKDPLCDNMEVLKPKERVFVGFDKKEE